MSGPHKNLNDKLERLGVNGYFHDGMSWQAFIGLMIVVMENIADAELERRGEPK